MIVDGETGFLTNNDEEMAYRLAQLAYDEDLRQAIIRSGPRRRPRPGLPGADRQAVGAVVRESGSLTGTRPNNTGKPTSPKNYSGGAGR